MRRITVILILNILTAVTGCIGLAHAIATDGAGCFVFYTNISNALAVLSSVLLGAWLAFHVKEAADGKRPPEWILCLKFASLIMMTVTFIIVTAVLAPFGPGYYAMFIWGSRIWRHLICPGFAIAAGLFAENAWLLSKRRIFFWGLLPTLLYGIVTFILNGTGVLTGPYPFLMVRNQSVPESAAWFAGILGGTAFFVWVIHLIRKACARVKL